MYRWIDKHYRAQVFNYGKRLMFEFVIPEPAAFVLYAFERERKQQERPDIPQRPSRPNLTISKITQEDVTAYGQIFDLGDLQAEPSETLSVSRGVAGTGLQETTGTAQKEDLTIPEGYMATKATVAGAFKGVAPALQGMDYGIYVSLGGKTVQRVTPPENTRINLSYSGELGFKPGLQGTIGITVATYRLVAFSANIALNSRADCRAPPQMANRCVRENYGRLRDKGTRVPGSAYRVRR